jgi:hypothetical protein
MGAITSSNTIPYSNHVISGDEIGSTFYAGSMLQETATNSFRYVFVSKNSGDTNEQGIVRCKIDGNGIQYDGFIPYQIQNATIYGLRAEMELVQLPNGHFKIAAPYKATGTHNGKDVSAAIYTAELDASGNVYNNQENTLYFYKSTNNQEDPYVHGLEFSPNGDYLYISHIISEFHP